MGWYGVALVDALEYFPAGHLYAPVDKPKTRRGYGGFNTFTHYGSTGQAFQRVDLYS
jgi:hypothetical protein